MNFDITFYVPESPELTVEHESRHIRKKTKVLYSCNCKGTERSPPLLLLQVTYFCQYIDELLWCMFLLMKVNPFYLCLIK